MVSITDIAQKVGVSPSTVSRVMNGKKYVNAEKKAQILKIIAETGYVPNKAARDMVLQRSFTVGIVIPDTFNVFQRQLFSTIERQLVSFGYRSLFFFVKFDSSSEKQCLDRLKSEKLDGVIMLHEIKSPEFYAYLDNTKIPIVSTLCNDNAIPTIKIDDKQAASDGVHHLINLGHRRITMIAGCHFSFGLRRLEGYYQALDEAGIERNEKLVVDAQQYSSEAGMYAMRDLLLRSRDFSAVFAASDELAIGAMRAMLDEGLRIPEDISIVGFDDIDISNYFHPRLTTLRQPIFEIGEQSALKLHRYINGQTDAECTTVLPHKLIIRESTCSATPSR
ncbi:MAG: LacI family transcriptional regulator [Treponema sp.]|jgi:LacI family transcriptional regulator|nr:LacI family transcriptional regulator [Treponema sp.]